VTVIVAAPFGLALSALLPRELEGMLVLLTVVAMQMMLNPDGTAARLLPFWFSREIGNYAIERDAGPVHVERGLLHAAVTLAIFFAVLAISTGVRLRRRSHLVTV